MMNMTRKEMLRKVQSADFAALDLALFLDTHPCCENAIKAYGEKLAEAKEAREAFEASYGPLTQAASKISVPWQWIQNPWTWEKEGN